MRSPATAWGAIAGRAVAAGAVLAAGIGGARVVNKLRYPRTPQPKWLSTDPADFPESLPGMTITRLSDGLLHGFHLRPDEVRYRGVAFVWGGSDGTPDFFRARQLADAGFEVFALFVFGQPGQPPNLSRVPLEFFDRALEHADAHAVDAGVVTLIGSSKGAELAALLPTFQSRVDNVVLFAPGDYVYQGLDFRAPASSWSSGGEELPYIDFGRSSVSPWPAVRMLAAMAFGYPMRLRPVYEAALSGAPRARAAEARIDAAALSGELLIFAGADDQMWQADTAARRLAADRADAGSAEHSEVHIYPGAGHVFALDTDHASGFLLGGGAAANRAAKAHSDEVLLERLREWHG